MTRHSEYLLEGDKVSSSDLKSKWSETLSFYDEMINNGHSLRPIRFLIRHIIDRGFDELYFPGTSLFTLLISVPADNKINFDKTLSVQVDELTNTVNFKYKDLTGLNRQNEKDLEKSLKWSETCQLTEASDTFEYFLSISPDWNVTLR
jgi:hypothetical protein